MEGKVIDLCLDKSGEKLITGVQVPSVTFTAVAKVLSQQIIPDIDNLTSIRRIRKVALDVMVESKFYKRLTYSFNCNSHSSMNIKNLMKKPLEGPTIEMIDDIADVFKFCDHERVYIEQSDVKDDILATRSLTPSVFHVKLYTSYVLVFVSNPTTFLVVRDTKLFTNVKVRNCNNFYKCSYKFPGLGFLAKNKIFHYFVKADGGSCFLFHPSQMFMQINHCSGLTVVKSLKKTSVYTGFIPNCRCYSSLEFCPHCLHRLEAKEVECICAGVENEECKKCNEFLKYEEHDHDTCLFCGEIVDDLKNHYGSHYIGLKKRVRSSKVKKCNACNQTVKNLRNHSCAGNKGSASKRVMVESDDEDSETKRRKIDFSDLEVEEVNDPNEECFYAQNINSLVESVAVPEAIASIMERTDDDDELTEALESLTRPVDGEMASPLNNETDKESEALFDTPLFDTLQ